MIFAFPETLNGYLNQPAPTGSVLKEVISGVQEGGMTLRICNTANPSSEQVVAGANYLLTDAQGIVRYVLIAQR